MGVFDLFKKNNTPKEEKKSYVNWTPLTTLSQLETIKKESTNESIAIFKHSTRCGISRMVIRQFEESFTEDMSSLKVYYLDLLNYREISNEVGYTFQVLHQSPQLLIIKNGVVVAHASHYDITQIPIRNFLK